MPHTFTSVLRDGAGFWITIATGGRRKHWWQEYGSRAAAKRVAARELEQLRTRIDLGIPEAA